MDLAFSPEDLAFRDEVRAFIQTRLPDDIRRKVQAGDHLDKDDYYRWHRILFERGWSAPNWPKEYGGPRRNPRQRPHLQQDPPHRWAPRTLPLRPRIGPPVI